MKFFKKSRKNNERKSEGEHIDGSNLQDAKWHDVGEGNPFDSAILDIRGVTLNIVATTREKSIADNYASSRSDNGEQFIDKEIEEGLKHKCDLHYPHNGEELEGIVYKADSMDVKWDIYAYGEWFYFVRSWTSELVYKVHYVNSGTELVLDFIVTAQDGDSFLHAQNIHSMILTHVLGRVWPYKIPELLAENTENDIALYLFAQFGNKATIATKANVLEMCLK